MAEENAEGSGSFPLNLPALLVLVTLASGVWLVSQKLTSTRPAASVGMGGNIIGEQRVEARLWEDPFKPQERDRRDGRQLRANFNILRDQIEKRIKKDDYHEMLILPVMLPGSFYSQDQESRIRSRFAIGSALGQSGYVPEDAEHIGSVTVSWGTPINDHAIENSPPKLAEIWPLQANEELPEHEFLDLRYEWYRPRVFYPQGTNELNSHVLVLWLNERYFEVEPLLRLPMLLAPIMNAAQKSDRFPRMVLIGPAFSHTLRAMLPDWTEPEPKKVQVEKAYPDLWPHIQKILRKIEVYSATATAMDATLVKKDTDDANRRDSVTTELKRIGFNSFKNFVATDDQIAEEMLEELKLRRVDFGAKANHNHLVLISEWDTFYARVLSLTYAAELAKRQGRVDSRAQFVKGYIDKSIQEPENLHWFVYVRGLDGQTVGDDLEAVRASGSGALPQPGRRQGTADAGKDDLRKWTPDANKAEGPAQFDYLSRLGEQLVTLEERLSRKDGHIRAIGVVGSDVYDTLLILQALRYRLPNALFFTTSLDARFWHPHELSWSRNMLVTSSYGLVLDRALQRSVPPFRDNFQTAQYTAVFAVLGHPELSTMTSIPPRRFEIGKRGAVDLSVPPSTPGMISNREPALHPPTAQSLPPPLRTYIGIGIVCLVAGVSATFFCGPLRRLTWDASQVQADSLRYREEDVGGIEGAWTIVRGLQKSAQEQNDRLGWWLSAEFKRVKLEVPPQSSSTEARQHGAKRPGGPPGHDYTTLLDRIGEASARIKAPAPAASGRSIQIAALEDSGVQGLGGHAEGPRMVLTVIGTEATPQAPDTDKTPDAARQEIEDCKEALLRGWLDCLNRLLHRKCRHPGEAVEHTSLLHEHLKVEWECWWPEPEVRDLERPEAPQGPEAPPRLRQGRAILDALLQKLGEEAPKEGMFLEPGMQKDILEKAHAAREASLKLYDLRRRWACQFWLVALVMMASAIGLSIAIWYDTFFTPEGERFSLTSGTSAWPGEILRFAAFALAISLSFQSYQSLRTMMFHLTRRFRLPLVSNPHLPWLFRLGRLPASPAAGSVVQVSRLWGDYQQYGIFGRRIWRILWTLGLYMMFSIGLVWLSQPDMLLPLRGSLARLLDRIILLGASFSFLFLAFMTIDAARLCQWFIQHVSQAPTDYPLATTAYFSRLRGHVDRRYLDEWIDLQLIADLTAQVGRLVYYPFLVFFLLLLARNEWWDRWTWPWALITIFVCNLVLAAVSVMILQTAARRAKKDAEASLEAKVKRLQAATAASHAQNDVNQAQKLLDEIRTLRRGAFVNFWENPVFRAILLPSGGTVVLQMLIWLMSP